MNAYPIQFASEQGVQLIPFVMTGDPSLEVTLEIVELLERIGVAAIELGFPFSDPQADGPTIQAASKRAMEQNNIALSDVIELGKQVRDRGGKVPLILFSYFNPLLQYGLSQLITDLVEAGFSGIIVPDLPHEESGILKKWSKEFDMPLIPLVAPNSKKRIAEIVNGAEGFIYCVSSLGSTGMRKDFANDVIPFLQEVKRKSSVPTAIGFGISTREQVSFFQEYCDGVIVGSALVQKVNEVSKQLLDPQSRQQGLWEIEQFIRDLKSE